VLELTKNLKQFSEAQDANDAPLYEASFGSLDITDFDVIYQKVKTWAGTQVYVNDEVIPLSDVSKWLICYRDKIKFLKSQPLFCWGASSFTANIFGCHRTKIRDAGWSWNNCWFSLGELDNSGTFHVDKNRIVALITDNLKPYYICPSLNPTFLMAGLKIIPDTINPRSDTNWEYWTSNGEIIGIMPKSFGSSISISVPETPQYTELMAFLERKLRTGSLIL